MKRRISLIIFTMIVLCLVMGSVAGPLLAAQGRGIGAGALPAEFKGVKVRDVFIPSTGKPVGVIQTIIGHVVVFREDVKQAYYSAPGDRLYERDSVYALKASRCRFKLDGEDVVTIAEDTRIGIRSFTENRARGAKNSAFSIVKGKAMFYALKLLRHRDAGMTVETPTAVVGVRGTKFGTEIHPIQDITSVHFFEGTGNVVSKVDGAATTIGAGQSVSATPAGLGNVLPTPPAVSQKFRTDTDAPAPVSKLKSIQTAAAPPPGSTSSSGSGAGTGTSSTTDATGSGTGMGTSTVNDHSAITQIQTTTNASSSGATTADSRPTEWKGFFTAAPRKTGDSTEIWVSGANLQDFSVAGSQAKDTLGTTLVTIEANKWVTPVMTEITLPTHSSGTVSKTISSTEIDHDAYVAWGSWTQADTIVVTPDGYKFTDNGYYVYGQITPVMTTSGTGTYTGKAYGTLATINSSTAATSLTGTFGMDVNFATGAISNFNITAKDSSDVTRVTITQTPSTTASFTGTGYQIISAPLTATINSVAATSVSVNGSFYGPNASRTGGNWVANNANNSAGGIFVGTK